MNSYILLIAACAGLLVGCVAREQARPQPTPNRFQALWDDAEEWAAPQDGQWPAQGGDAVATTLFWPRHADKPGLNLGRPASPDALRTRREHVLAAHYRIELNQDPVPDGLAVMLFVPSPADNMRWRIPPGWEWAHDTGVQGPFLEVDREGRLYVGRPWGVARVRVVFSLEPEPTPTSLYTHGSEVTVASWGVAVRPVTVEYTDGGGRVIGSSYLEPRK